MKTRTPVRDFEEFEVAERSFLTASWTRGVVEGKEGKIVVLNSAT